MNEDGESREKESEAEAPRPEYRSLVTVASLSTAGLTLALSVAIGVGAGILLDRQFKTNWIVIVGLMIGVIAGFKQLIKIVVQAAREEERAEAERRKDRE